MTMGEYAFILWSVCHGTVVSHSFQEVLWLILCHTYQVSAAEEV